jgi:hypothetical protein
LRTFAAGAPMPAKIIEAAIRHGDKVWRMLA